MKVWQVVRRFALKTGGSFDVPYRTFSSDAAAKAEAKQCQDDMAVLVIAELYLPDPKTNKMVAAGHNVGALLTQLGIVSYSHVISAQEVATGEATLLLPQH